MNSDTVLAISLGIGVPLFIIIVVFLIFCILRCRARSPKHQGYDKVSSDTLDEEEIEFQRMIESKHGYIDEDFGLGLNGEGGDNGDEDISEEDIEFGFSAKEKDRLSMLEQFRSNLVAGADSDIHSEDTDDDSATKQDMRL